MEKIEPSSVLLIFLGSVLTFLATLLVETIKNNREASQRTVNLQLLIRQELIFVKKLLERLKTTLELKNYYGYDILDQLVKSLGVLESYKKDVIYLTTIDQQEEYIDLVSDLSSSLSNSRSLQTLFDTQKKLHDEDSKLTIGTFKELQEYFNQTKLQYSIEFVEIKRRIDEFLKKITDK